LMKTLWVRLLFETCGVVSPVASLVLDAHAFPDVQVGAVVDHISGDNQLELRDVQDGGVVGVGVADLDDHRSTDRRATPTAAWPAPAFHMRQQAAIFGVQLACVISVAVPLLVAPMALRAPKPSRWLAAGRLLLATDPVHHLNHRWNGWLGGPRCPCLPRRRSARASRR
jgi:hypothetical protein